MQLKNKVLLGILMMICSWSASAQCPEITIDQKYDHIPTGLCAENGWDTVVNCRNRTLILNATPFITTQHFNGTYLVESIPYNPVDPTFHAGSRLNITQDDQWEQSTISFPFTFMFFGYPYTQALVGSNGLVSFNTTQAGAYCDYTYSVPIPAVNFSTANNTSKNAIYGVYEDIDPRYLENTTTGGMFRYVGGEYPCRHLCASVNGVGLFGNNTNYNTYQIVCYEGTNIIEVHVKDRLCCASTNSGKGLIGIQNASGSNQESHYHDPNYMNTPPFYIEANSPGAFVAPNRGNQSGGWTGETHNEAWRFTPQGETAKNIFWWRLFLDDEGNVIDSVQLTANAGDTNGYYLNPEHTQVSVTRTSKYVVQCVYRGANGSLYGVDNRSMRDTITIGLDTAKDMQLTATNTSICEGDRIEVNLTLPNEDQHLDSCGWSAVRLLNGERRLVNSAITNHFTAIEFDSRQGDHIANKLDSTWIYCTASYTNGCTNTDSILVVTYPNYAYFDTVGICRGESYRWYYADSVRYTDFVQPQQTLDTLRRSYSVIGCDSVNHLHLIVSDISFTTDKVLDCAPHTWINGRTYSANNDDTRDQDTVILTNSWGCDSTVTLDFTFIPMKAIIAHTPEVATIDELTIELTDESYGHDSHLWLLPNGRTTTSSSASIIFPLSGVDTMDVRLAVHNNYGCDDTALVRIPLIKVSNFIPNAFTPDRNDNNRFYPSIQGNVNDIKVYIYNRFGEQVCYFQGSDAYWDGTDMQGRKCPQGAYVYVIRYRTALEPNITQTLKGSITLIR
ncbi:MAG: gliding motility-associated C-terminal domain-containing protein [Bacteroidales bacterium]|nr:gliding motility-associated C-terminal domain-containing protein [Bacteroidales bacterium]